MTYARTSPVLLTVLAVLLLGDVTDAAGPPAQAPAPEAPLTPGAAAALVLPKGQPDRDRLLSAIADPHPQVRAVAARVAAVLIRTDLGPALAAALAKEQDPLAATEQARAFLLLHRNAAVGGTTEAASRLGGGVRLVLAEWLARNNPLQFSKTFAEVTNGMTDEDAREIGRIASMAAQQTPERLVAITETLLAAAVAETWRSYLVGLAESGRDYTAPLSSGLTARDATLRKVTWWYALSLKAEDETPKAALAAALASEVPDEQPWTLTARHVLARRLHETTPTDQSAIFRAHADEARKHQGTLATLPELTDAERVTLRSLLGESYPVERPAPRPVVPARQRLITARNLTPIVPGLLNSVLSVTGCKPSERYDVLAGAGIKYRLDGRPLEIGIDTTRVSRGCGEAVRILANLSVAERDEPVFPDRVVWVFLPTETSIVNCIDGPDSPRLERTSGGTVQAPKTVRQVNPQYPAAAIKARIQGVVVIEATIAESGCVKRAAVTGSVHLSLDIEALRAVSQWRYTPTLLGGQAVPVIMSVTVNFTLQ